MASKLSIVIAGTVSRDAEIRGKSDNKVLAFTIPVEQGWGDRKHTEWFRISSWYKESNEKQKAQAERMRNFLKKGCKVAIDNFTDFKVSVYNDKPNIDVTVNMGSITVLQFAGQKAAGEPTVEDGNGVEDGVDDEDLPAVDGDLPF